MRTGFSHHLVPQTQRCRRQLQPILAAVAHQHRWRLQPHDTANRPPADSPYGQWLAHRQLPKLTYGSLQRNGNVTLFLLTRQCPAR